MILISTIIGILMNTTECKEDFLTELFQNHKYNWEVALLLLIAFLVYYYFQGVVKNKQVLTQFLDNSVEIFRQNFYHVGLKLDEFEQINTSANDLVEQEHIVEHDTPNFYRMYLTGRYNTKYCILSINTKRRQDFLISLLYSIMWPEKDRILLECALPDTWSEKGLLYII